MWTKINNLIFEYGFYFLALYFLCTQSFTSVESPPYAPPSVSIDSLLTEIKTVRDQLDIDLKLKKVDETAFVPFKAPEESYAYQPTFPKESSWTQKLDYMRQHLYQPEVNFALAVHESAGFTSKLFKRSNNMFCHVYTAKRPSDFKVYSAGDGHYKMGWKTWQQAVRDMRMWQDNMIKRGKLDVSSPQAYMKSLKRLGYATDPSHMAKVNQTFKKYFTMESPENI